jgi:hypothetical protein
MADLTDEEKKTLERLRALSKLPKKPAANIHDMDKFTDNVLVPESEYRDWHEVADKGKRRPSKKQRGGGKPTPGK